MKQDSYLASLIRKVTGEEVVEAPQASADLSALQAEFDAFKTSTSAEVAELKTQLEAAVAHVAQADEAVTTLQAKLADAEARAAAADKAKADLAAEAEAKRIAARKEKLESAVGTAQAAAMFDATVSLTDEAFDLVVSGFKASGETESRSRFFREQGADAQVDAGKASTEVESTEMKLLKQMFPQQDAQSA